MDSGTNNEQIDSAAFEILVMEHHKRLLAYAYSLVPRQDVVEDLVQESFLIAYQRLDHFDRSRSFGAWMRGIVRRKYLEWRRAQKEFATDPQTLNAIEEQHAEWDEVEDEPGQTFKALTHCIGELPDTLGQPINLYYVEQLAGPQVAEQLETSEPTIRKRLQRAREKLAACITRTLTTLIEGNDHGC